MLVMRHKENKMRKIIILVSVCFLFGITQAGPVFDKQTPAGLANASTRAVKKTDNWTKMETQLAQYDDHYTSATNKLNNYDGNYSDVTNKIDLVTDAKTKTALLKMAKLVNDEHTVHIKSLKAIDDVHDALQKLIKCFKDMQAASK